MTPKKLPSPRSASALRSGVKLTFLAVATYRTGAPCNSTTASARPPEPSKRAKLGYLQQRELDGMQATIERAERRKAEIEVALADPSNSSNAGRVQELAGELSSVNAQIERLYSRWQELEQG